MGIYDSNMSCWQRRKAGLPQDHAGGKTIEVPVKKEAKVVEEVVELTEKELKAIAKAEKKAEKEAEKIAKAKAKAEEKSGWFK